MERKRERERLRGSFLDIYIATGAEDSTELEIKLAFERVNLSQYISGYFCKSNMGLTKGSDGFIEAIIAKLNISKNNVAMVGNNFEKDIKPAIAVGLKSFWLTANAPHSIANNITVIKNLSDLY